MIGMNSYLSGYVDRRMKYIVDEWDLSTKADLADFVSRLEALEGEIPRLQAFERTASERLADLETRARELKGRA